MYRNTNKFQKEAENFELPFGGRLSGENRWVKLAKLIPWSEFETEYASQFSSKMGAPAKPFRMALGGLIIKERLGTSDEETVEQIKENPDLQYFLGLTEYTNEAPFEASMLVHFRKRLSRELVGRINEQIVLNRRQTARKAEKGKQHPETEETNAEESEPSSHQNQGKLILDATCTPADISYPTDLKLLNQAREQTEKVLDFQLQLEQYKQRFGYYPESVHVDRIYRTRTNRAIYKKRGIRISGSPLGRPPVNPPPEMIKQQREDERFRNAIESKFGQAKSGATPRRRETQGNAHQDRRFSLSRIMARLSDTAESIIAITFLVMNLELLLRQFFVVFFGFGYKFLCLKEIFLRFFGTPKKIAQLFLLPKSSST